MLVKNLNELAKYAGLRKHGSQLEKHEEIGLFKRLKTIKETDWVLLPHALQRLAEKKIEATRQDVISTILHSTIIEYRIVHNTRTGKFDERVVLRSKAIVNRKYNLNVVFSLTDKKVVTVWNNHIKDRHNTLDWSIYCAEMKVFGI